MCPKRMQTDIDRRFMFVRLGYSYRVGEIEGALGLAQLERKDEIMERRRKNAQYLIRGLKKFDEILQLPTAPENIEHTYMMFPILIKPEKGISGKRLVAHLEANNIETRPMLPLLNQPIYRQIFGNIEDEYPVAKYINQNGFYLGCHHGMEKKQLDYVISILAEFIHEAEQER